MLSRISKHLTWNLEVKVNKKICDDHEEPKWVFLKSRLYMFILALKFLMWGAICWIQLILVSRLLSLLWVGKIPCLITGQWEDRSDKESADATRYVHICYITSKNMFAGWIGWLAWDARIWSFAIARHLHVSMLSVSLLSSATVCSTLSLTTNLWTRVFQVCSIRIHKMKFCEHLLPHDHKTRQGAGWWILLWKTMSLPGSYKLSLQHIG